jgi:hypothetical protein
VLKSVTARVLWKSVTLFSCHNAGSPAVTQDSGFSGRPIQESLATLTLQYSKEELASYTHFRVSGISEASIPWMKRCSLTFWKATRGTIGKEKCDALREHLCERYADPYAPRKVMNFATAFLKYLSRTHFGTRYQAFDLFLEMPKGLKARKHVTSRTVTEVDVKNVLSALNTAFEHGELDKTHYFNFRALVLFGAFTGQRPQATRARLFVGQFRSAVSQEKPVLDILPHQDKIHLQHYRPLHPQVVDAVFRALDGHADSELLFKQLSFERWVKQQKIQLSQCDWHFVPSDLRKFAEQQADVLQWDASNKNYILTHDVSGVD